MLTRKSAGWLATNQEKKILRQIKKNHGSDFKKSYFDLTAELRRINFQCRRLKSEKELEKCREVSEMRGRYERL